MTQNGDLITIHGVRNFDYRSETDFTPRWEDRTYDLRQLDSGDLIAVYWAGKAIAHIMVSFGFAGRDYVAVSIETRKARGQSYSTLAGFFKQYELVYVVADERDLIGLRTSYRKPQEDVYVYRLQTPRENLRRVFLDYVKTMNDMREHPQFYNTLTTNCTTSVLLHSAGQSEGAPPWSWKILVSGYVPQYVYELGRLDTTRALCRAGASGPGQRPRARRRARSRVLAAHSTEGAISSGPGGSSMNASDSELFDIMHTTRAMRRLKPDPVPDALIRKILEAGVCAPNGGNTQRWRFLVIKDRRIKQAVQAFYKRAFDEVVGPRYLKSAPPPGVTREAYDRQHAAVEYLTDHFHEAPVWIVACLEEGTAAPTRWSGASIYPAVQNMLLAARALGLGRDADHAAPAVREGDGGRARPAARRALVRDPSDRLPDGASSGPWAGDRSATSCTRIAGATPYRAT